MEKFFLRCMLLLCVGTAARAQFQFEFDAQENRWRLNNGRVEAFFQLISDGRFSFQQITDLRTGDTWTAPPGASTSPARLWVDDTLFDSQTPYRLVSQSSEAIPRNGYRQTIVLEDQAGVGRVQISLEMYDNQPVLRYNVRFKNLGSKKVWVRSADMLRWGLADGGKTYRTFRVTQWVPGWVLGEFKPRREVLKPNGPSVDVFSGAHGQYCGWLALRDQSDRGLFAGWEFDGRAVGSVWQLGDQGRLQLSAEILDLHHPLEPDEEFQVPPAFFGLFHGDWDEAGYRTQQFAEAALTKPSPDPGRFPYVAWDSWRYETDVNESVLRRNAELAAQLGIELFTVDLGWARQIGDWRADPRKFPNGLRALSDYVHSLGMKFGLHFVPTEAAPDSPILQEHPDWTSSENSGYYEARSLCLSNRETKEWLIEEGVRMIDEYGVDWILQDGENMVKECTKTTHSHDPADSNYSNAVDGLNAVIGAIQQRRPNTVWENCEDGGNMMTFNMLRYYVTSINNDSSGSFGARRTAFGATYPFPTRYTDRYMPEENLDRYTTRSYMFGGPWIFMNRMPQMSSASLALAASEIQLYKALRGRIQKGKIFHLTRRPKVGRIDAIESCDSSADSAVVFVTRDSTPTDTFKLLPRGLKPDSSYQVRFESDSRVVTMGGAQLMNDGVSVSLPQSRSAEIVYFDPLPATP